MHLTGHMCYSSSGPLHSSAYGAWLQPVTSASAHVAFHCSPTYAPNAYRSLTLKVAQAAQHACMFYYQTQYTELSKPENARSDAHGAIAAARAAAGSSGDCSPCGGRAGRISPGRSTYLHRRRCRESVQPRGNTLRNARQAPRSHHREFMHAVLQITLLLSWPLHAARHGTLFCWQLS